jgi:uncharacterized protein with GYD domain
MLTFVMLTRLSGKESFSEENLIDLEKKVKEQIKTSCPKVKWIANYAILGPVDYLDVFEAPDHDTAMKVALLIRSFGHASTEIWGAKEWKQFKALMRELA